MNILSLMCLLPLLPLFPVRCYSMRVSMVQLDTRVHAYLKSRRLTSCGAWPRAWFIASSSTKVTKVRACLAHRRRQRACFLDSSAINV
ncbi:hypothetical protein B0I35DRAFT_11389 [Stachybotrys elegans]|uniref:Secreted protein n=1 Tax=Stachybotrys elegans TaxID=80388 RepID=A0A8K0WWI2_9HYPO|nr:hypothetical protein B0I35DRAFT_11389 [Stachybotrys elegans]